jgi:RNA polymerase sigma-70 factor (ECF subfamily)
MSTLPQVLRASWNDFVHECESLRPDLYRYCRHLTRSPWDAEDLAQDTLARAFVTLAQMGDAPPNPRAWLFRVASNLWIDRVRRARRELPLDEEPLTSSEPRTVREAAGTLLGQLSPQERAAVVLKDVFDLSLEETADTLETTVGAIKTALHRARGKLAEPAPEVPAAAPAVLDAFCAAFNAGDIDRLAALLLDNASVEVVGATTQYGREAAKRTVLWGMLFGASRMPDTLGKPPRVELRAHRGEWVIVHYYAHEDGEAVRALTRVAGVMPDGIGHVANYFFNPELIAEICAELALPWRSNGRDWCKP